MKMFKYIISITVGIFLVGSFVYAQTILFPRGGGTGKNSATAGDVGKYLKVSDDSPFTYTFDTPAGGGGGADGNWSFFNGSGIKLATTTNQVLIGAAATTSLAALEVQSSLGILTTGSTTLQNFTFVNGTGTSATTTNALSVGGALTVTGNTSLQKLNFTIGTGTRLYIPTFYDSTGLDSISPENRAGYRLGVGVLDWTNLQLIDSNAALSVDWGAHLLVAPGVNALDWTNASALQLPAYTTDGFLKTSGGTGILTVDSSTYLTGNETITLSGEVTGSGATAITTTIDRAISPTWTGAHIFSNANSILATGSTTLQNFTGLNSTTTNATTTSFFSSKASTTALWLTTGSSVLRTVNGLVSQASNGTDFTLLTTTTCGGTDKVSAVTASGGVTCSTDQTGGAGTSAFEIATTTDIAVPQVAYFTQTSGRTTLGSVATGTLSVPTGLTITGNRYVLGGSASIALDTGYVIPLQSTLDGKLSSYDAWTHPSAGVSATTSSMIFTNASSTFTGNLNITGNSTTSQATTTNLAITSITSKKLRTNANGSVIGLSATGTTPVFNAFTSPDTSGNAIVEPYTISAVNDVFAHFTYVASSTTAKVGFSTAFHIEPDFNGTTASVVIYFSCPVTTGNIVWDVDYRAIGGDDTESLDQTTFQESVTATKACGSAVNERQTVYMALTASNFAADDTVEMSVSRDGADANDTGVAGAMIHDVVFQYQ